jgi:DUF4097 and DUF4098 domain-containing protein YvlB
MRTTTKVWLIIATSLVLVGCTLFAGVMSTLGWDFTKLSTVEYETNDYEITENFKNISIITDTADIVFVPSKNSKAFVFCYEQKNEKHSITVKDNTLVIKALDRKKWHEYIGINFKTPKITVSIPQGEYGKLLIKGNTGGVEIPKDFKFENIDIEESTGSVTNYASAAKDIKIKTSTGDILAQSISAFEVELLVSTGGITASNITAKGDMKVSVSTGKANLTDIECKDFMSTGNTGDIYLRSVIAREKFSIERSTGTVKFDSSDAAEIFVRTDTGDVIGTLLTDKVFIAQTDTGYVDVPKTETGGRCEIITDTGNIKLEIR